jgi:pilus assembly protein CpaF
MRQQIASAIDIVIQVSRLSDGTRKLISISEISGMEGDVITMQEIFVFERQGVTPEGDVVGRFKATGIRPKAADRLASYGVKLGEMLFMNEVPQTAEHGRFVP